MCGSGVPKSRGCGSSGMSYNPNNVVIHSTPLWYPYGWPHGNLIGSPFYNLQPALTWSYYGIAGVIAADYWWQGGINPLPIIAAAGGYEFGSYLWYNYVSDQQNFFGTWNPGSILGPLALFYLWRGMPIDYELVAVLLAGYVGIPMLVNWWNMKNNTSGGGGGGGGGGFNGGGLPPVVPFA
jgi:hypothetical protein